MGADTSCGRGPGRWSVAGPLCVPRQYAGSGQGSTRAPADRRVEFAPGHVDAPVESVRRQRPALELRVDRLPRAAEQLGGLRDRQPLPFGCVTGELVAHDLAREVADEGLE